MPVAPRRPFFGRARLLAPLLVGLLGSACAFCAHQSQPAAGPPVPVTLLFSTALVGHLEPCGCSADQLGGLDKAASVISDIRKEGQAVVLVDGGDRFFPSATASTDPMVAAQHRLQADAMARATALMKYDAVVLGLRDAWAGAEFFGGLPVPLLDTGSTGQSFTKTSLVVNAGGVPVGLFAVGDEPDAGEIIRSRAQGLKAQGVRLTVLLAYRSFEKAKALLPVAREVGVALVLAGRADDPETHDSAELGDSQPPLLTVKARGEALLRVDLFPGGETGAPFLKIAGQAERRKEIDALQGRIDQLRKDAIALSPLDPMARLKTDKLLALEARKSQLAAAPPPKFPPGSNVLTYSFIPVSPKLAPDASLKAVIEGYDTQVATRNFAYAKEHPKECPRPRDGEASYSGDATCIDCHEEAVAFWKTTPHAKAFDSLVKRGKQYDTACIGCHVVGYQQPGGTCDIAQTAGREAVQCESCHGPGSTHVEAGSKGGIALQVPEKTCRKCHDPENSPHFNDTTYRPQILGPGHGMPMAAKKKG